MAIAVALLVCFGIITKESIENTMFFGELGLDGSVQKIKGILPMAVYGIERGIRTCFVPAENEEEARLVNGLKVAAVATFDELLAYIRKPEQIPEENGCKEVATSKPEVDFADIRGQSFMKRAAEIAVAGGHNLFLVGSPGTGKSMTAKRIITIFPDLTEEESLEITKIYSIAGCLEGKTMMRKRPFRAPHHTVTIKGMTGGGRIPKPGEITLAQKGVLFLDEIAEFPRNVIEVLRQPMEEKKIVISRSGGTYTFPADFMLVAACNPCPCGYYPDRNRCNCTEYERKKYMAKLGGPFLDRMDLWVRAPQITYQDLTGDGEGKSRKSASSAEMKERVMQAREIQRKRYEGTVYMCNGALSAKDTEKYCQLGAEEKKLAEEIFSAWSLSARSYYKMLKVARTIADLDGCVKIAEEHLLEAGAYRSMNQ